MPPATKKRTTSKKKQAAGKKKKGEVNEPKVEEASDELEAKPRSEQQAQLPKLTVARLLNEAQLGVSMHRRIVKQMHALREKDSEKFLADVCNCLLHVLLEYKVRRSFVRSRRKRRERTRIF